MKKKYTEKDFIENFDNIKKVKGREIKEFYCKDCNEFLILDDKVLRFLIKNRNIPSGDGLVIKPKIILGKEYYRVKCFDCFIKKFDRKPKKLNIVNYDMEFLLEVPKKEIEEYIANRVNTYENTIKKYGEEEGKKKWEAFLDKNGNSLENCIRRHGEEEGKKKWEEWKKACVQTYENFVRRHGEEADEKWKEFIEKKLFVHTKDGYIARHGEVEGRKRYEEDCSKKANTLENFIARHGEVEGRKKFAEWKKLLSVNSSCRIEYYLNNGLSFEEAEKALKTRQTTVTIEKYIKKLGEKEGRKRYEVICRKRIENIKFYSIISQKLFNEIVYYGNIDVTNENIYFATLNCEFFLNQKGGKFYLYDFTDLESKKIIEFNGDFWHANPILYEAEDLLRFPGGGKTLAKEIWLEDEMKLSLAKSKGFEVLIIWESEYAKDEKGIIQKCINFLKGKQNE